MRAGISCHVIAQNRGASSSIEEPLQACGVAFNAIYVQDNHSIQNSGSTGIFLVILDDEIDNQTLNLVLRSRQKNNALVIAIIDESNSLALSRALALGFDDAIFQPIVSDLLRHRLEFYHNQIVSNGEYALRSHVLTEFRQEPVGETSKRPLADPDNGKVLLVGPACTLHVQLSGILGANRFVYASNVDAVQGQLFNSNFRVVIFVHNGNEFELEEFKSKIASLRLRLGFATVLALQEPFGGINEVPAAQEFMDYFLLPLPPEFLRLRVGYWLRYAESRVHFRELADWLFFPYAVDPTLKTYNLAFASEYLKAKLSQNSKSMIGLIGIKFRGVAACNRQLGGAHFNRILARVSDQIRDILRGDDLTAYLSNGAFVCVLEIEKLEQLEAIAGRIKSKLRAHLRTMDRPNVTLDVETRTLRAENDGWSDIDLIIEAFEDQQLTSSMAS